MSASKDNPREVILVCQDCGSYRIKDENEFRPAAVEAKQIAAAIQAVDTFKRHCPSCGKEFKDGDTCPRGGCPMGGDL